MSCHDTGQVCKRKDLFWRVIMQMFTTEAPVLRCVFRGQSWYNCRVKLNIWHLNLWNTEHSVNPPPCSRNVNVIHRKYSETETTDVSQLLAAYRVWWPSFNQPCISAPASANIPQLDLYWLRGCTPLTDPALRPCCEKRIPLQGSIKCHISTIMHSGEVKREQNYLY